MSVNDRRVRKMEKVSNIIHKNKKTSEEKENARREEMDRQ